MGPSCVWRDAIRPDRPLLQAFCCTKPAPRDKRGRPRPHLRPWERQVEAWIRQLTPPAGHRRVLRVAGDFGTILGVSALRIDKVLEPVPIVQLQVIAIHVHMRGTGGSFADQMMADSLQSALRLAVQASKTGAVVLAAVDPRNAPSQRLLRRSGFIMRAVLANDLQEWAGQIP